MNFVEEYAKRVKTNPEWRVEHTKFINAQIAQANEFYKRLILTKGKKQFQKITGASNTFTENFYKQCIKSA